MKSILKKLAIAAIIVTAIMLRLVNLTEIPAFHADEMAFGYGAFSYLTAGRDEFGRPLGLVWESVGDYKLTPVVFASMPFIAIGRLNEFTTRLPSVIWGIGSCVLLYGLIKKHTQSKTLAALAGILMLITPWHILFSRTANEAMLLLFLTLLGLYFYTKASHSKVFLMLAALTLSVATISYYAAFIYLPLLTLTFYLCTKGWQKNKLYILPVVAVILTNILFLTTQPLGRVNQTNLFTSDTIQNRQQQLLSNQSSDLPPFVTRFLYNKPVLTLSQLSQNFFDHFTYTFLFSKGDTNTSRYSLPNMGALFSWQLPFLLIGAVIILANISKKPVYIFVWAALILALIPNSLSVNGPVTQRTLNALPPLIFLIALGLYTTYNYLQKYKPAPIALSILLTPIITYQLLFFVNDLVIQMPRTRPDLRQGFAKETVEKINELEPQFKKVYASDGGTYISHFFYNSTDPQIASHLLQDREYTGARYIMLPRVENTMFMNIDCPTTGKKDILYVCKGEYIPYNSEVLHVIRHPNGYPARTFIRFIEPQSVSTNTLPQGLTYAKETIADPQLLPVNSTEDFGKDIDKNLQ